MAVYMIFKYSKRFRFAPSFNNWNLTLFLGGGGGFGRCPPEQRISFKNLPSRTTEQEVKDLFRENIGDVTHIELYRDEDGKVRQMWYLLVAVESSGILKAKPKLGVTLNFDKQDVINFTKFSKMTMCRASEANS